MLIVSSVSSRILGELGEDGLLLLYADELKKNLVAIGKLNPDDIDQKSSFEILKMQYELALVDYMRFMAGWGTWGRWPPCSAGDTSCWRPGGRP